MSKKISFYPTDIDYKVIDGKPTIFLYGKLHDGHRIIVVDKKFKPYFYVVPKKGEEDIVAEKISKLQGETRGFPYSVEDVEKQKRKVLGREVNALKVFINIPKAVPVVKEIINEWEMIEGCYEFDINYFRRYLIDNKLTMYNIAEVEGEQVQIKARGIVIEADKITQEGEDTLKDPKILAIDIESYNPHGKAISFEEYPIIMIALYGKNFKKVITWKRFKDAEHYVEFVESEAELIEKFKDAVEQYKPDILTGYYSDGFDLPYIHERARKYKVKLDLGMDYSELDITKTRANTKARIMGIVHIDVFKFVRKIVSSSLETDVYSLNSVSEELLGEKKVDVDMDKLHDVWDNHPEELGEYCKYNLKDSILAHKLCVKILPNLIELVKIVGLTLFDVNRMSYSQLVESYLIKEAQGFNELIPNRPSHEDIRNRLRQTYQGGFVFEPKPGLYKDIAIFDYRSLYPTIMSAHNISPETLYCECCKGESAGKKVKDDQGEYYFCKKTKGFLSSMIKDIITRRMRVKEIIKNAKEKDRFFLEARSYGLKILANAFYGYMGFYAARWYSIECARATTAYGRDYIHKVIDKAEEEKFKVIYSDTDSIFLLLEENKMEDVHKFIEKINKDLPDLMELEYEGMYPSGIFVSAKMGDAGAKKKYAVLDDKGVVKVKGFESIRRNWSPIAKEVQTEILKMILKENDVEKAVDYVVGIISELEKGSIDNEKVIISTQIQKEIEDYDSKGPHVKAAIRMKNKGITVRPGTAVQYIVVKGEGIIGDRVRLVEEVEPGKYDDEYYIKNQVVPAVESIFNVLDIDVKELTADKNQSKLEGFF